jgi:hypothetical protein
LRHKGIILLSFMDSSDNHMSTGFIWRFRSGICHFYIQVYTPVFFCQDKNGGAGIAMRRQKFEKMESFGSGDAHGK